MDLRELERLGLYDPESPDAAGRAELLELLASRGVTTDEMVAANTIGRLPFVLGDRLMRPGEATLTLEEVAARTGLAAELILRTWAAVGLGGEATDAMRFSEDDVRALQVLSVALAKFGEAPTLQLLRVWGDSLARMAAAGFQTSLVHAPDSYLVRAPSEAAAALASAELGVMAVGASAATDVVFRHHLIRASRWYDRTFGPEPEIAKLAVGFADLVGFTTLSGALDPHALAEAVEAFDALTSSAISSAGGHRVKLIGDSVMFAADAASGVRVAVALIEAIARDERLPPARAAVASGEVLARDGDYFGPVVNLAARLLGVAAPNTVVAPGAAAADAGGRRVEPLGEVEVRGFAAPVDCVAVHGDT